MRFTTRPTIGVLLAAGWSVLGSSAHADILHVPGDFPTIQAAIDAAMDGDEVEVHPGTYNENINLLGKAITVRSSDGPEVTTIDAGGSGRVVTCTNEEGPDTVLDGFTLTGGNASEGGGIFFDDSQATINNCAIIGNVADDGAGIKCLGSSPMISNCTISENFTPNWGGGIYCRINSSPTIINCTISDNTAAGDGGGGISCSSNSSPSITNCVFRGNAAAGGGAIRCNNNSNPIITNCTFSGNLALGLGGGIYNAGGIVTLDNCILWGDNAHDGPEIALAGSSSVLTVSYCDVQGGQGDVSIGDASTLNWVSGNIDFDPLFVDADNANVHLSPGSPCIDAANNEAVPAGVVTDLDGNPRFVDNPDSDDCWQAPGTCGEPPIVDMGSYENQGGAPELCEPGDPANTCAADLTGDCQVEAFDLAILLGAWGPCP